MRRRPIGAALPWLLVWGATWGAVVAFFARGAYVYNWKLDASRSALVVKPDWFGPAFVDFATVRGAVQHIWDTLGSRQAVVVELPFNSPIAAGAVVILLALVGLLAFGRAAVALDRRR